MKNIHTKKQLSPIQAFHWQHRVLNCIKQINPDGRPAKTVTTQIKNLTLTPYQPLKTNLTTKQSTTTQES